MVAWSDGRVSSTETASRGERAKGESGGKVHNSDPAILPGLRNSFDREKKMSMIRLCFVTFSALHSYATYSFRYLRYYR